MNDLTNWFEWGQPQFRQKLTTPIYDKCSHDTLHSHHFFFLNSEKKSMIKISFCSYSLLCRKISKWFNGKHTRRRVDLDEKKLDIHGIQTCVVIITLVVMLKLFVSRSAYLDMSLRLNHMVSNIGHCQLIVVSYQIVHRFFLRTPFSRFFSFFAFTASLIVIYIFFSYIFEYNVFPF